MSNFLTALWDRLKTAIEGEATTVEATLSDLEQKLMPGFSALMQQIEKTIGAQGVKILEDGLSDVAAVVATGGNIGTLIATLVPQVTGQVEDSLKQDAVNAAHGAVSLILAALPTSTPAVETTPETSTPA